MTRSRRGVLGKGSTQRLTFTALQSIQSWYTKSSPGAWLFEALHRIDGVLDQPIMHYGTRGGGILAGGLAGGVARWRNRCVVPDEVKHRCRVRGGSACG